MLSCCLWMDERNHRPTKQQVENCRKECQEHWQGLRELCWKFTVDVLERRECQQTHLPGCLGGVNAFTLTAALNSFAFLHFLLLARSFAPYREERWPRRSKNPGFFKSIHLPEIDNASPWILKGGRAQCWSSPYKACGYSPCFNRYFDLIKSSATEKSAYRNISCWTWEQQQFRKPSQVKYH